MHYLLERFLNKKGIKDVTELKEEEKQVYDEWQKTFLEGEVTLDKVVEFCKNQINIIEGQWKNLDNSKEKNERLILLHTVYKTLIDVITKPIAAKERLEEYLTSLLK